MAYLSLSRRDINVLEKIRDPEFDPSRGVRVETTSAIDPHITDPIIYQNVATKEKELVLRMQQAEMELENNPSATQKVIEVYRRSVSELDRLIQEYPKYASARNNRAQALRRLYGDGLLVARPPASSQSLVQNPVDTEEQISGSRTALADLDEAIALLSPTSPFVGVSPTAAKTLSLAHTQRAAIYHATSRLLGQGHSLAMGHGRRECGWKALEFETAASRDFTSGGRYGNEIAKGLAVSTNPTAKLCGQMVEQMMKREFGEDSHR